MSGCVDRVRQEEILNTLDRLVRRDECVLTYDASLISELPVILAENRGVRSDADIAKERDLLRLFELLQPGARDAWRVADLPSRLLASGVALDRFTVTAPHANTAKTAAEFDHWTEKRATEDLESVLTLQKDLGMGRYTRESRRHGADLDVGELRNYLRSVTTAPPSLLERLLRRSFWQLRIEAWKRRGLVSGERPTLSVGPRWVTEIQFFRRVLGLHKHIGLDLFSDSPELVVVGDMHHMPFPAEHFNLLFLKNVVDKSYDVRVLVTELIRVVEPGGVVVVDQICGYGACTPLTRTDIQRAGNLSRLFEARARCRRLVCHDVDVSGIGETKGTGARRYNARLALQILK